MFKSINTTASLFLSNRVTGLKVNIYDVPYVFLVLFSPHVSK